ncbi:MAG: 5'-methylthioadenosine/adenosylhomocysteine nucleosidase [Lachnospiraceae bacterium]|nr:5'-methylthioadenosine/adenosylhomocysteine nucleosidase [Lachnospiraceae bacterium]
MTGKPVQTDNGKEIRRIGIIAAMEVEMLLLKEQIEDRKTETIAGTEFYSGRIGEYEVVLIRCGIGKVSAALSAQAMILRYQPDCIINTGCAGALARGLEIGGMVISDATVEWDIDMLAIGLPRGIVTSMNAVKMQADTSLSNWIQTGIPEDMQLVRGLVVSGDQFISTQQQRDIILGAFPEAQCAEMEGGAIGHVCAQNGVPFSVIRCMSDTADGDSEVNFPAFVKEAGKKSAEILMKLLRG